MPKSKKTIKNISAFDKITTSLFKRIKRDAKRRGIKFSITISYIAELFQKQQGLCALTGLKLILPKSGRSDKRATASLDRINSKKGYIKGNCQFIDKRVNMMKYVFSQSEFIKMCKLVAKHKK